jgi:hypothetical protein
MLALLTLQSRSGDGRRGSGGAGSRLEMMRKKYFMIVLLVEIKRYNIYGI